MGRKSVLTEKQWNEAKERILKGENRGAVAKSYGISYNALKKHFGSEIEQIKAVANQVIEAEQAFYALPIGSQISSQNLINELRAVSFHLVGAAKNSAMTAHRLSGIANMQVDKIDDARPMDNEEAITAITTFTKMANESSKIGLDLLKANKEGMSEEQQKSVIEVIHSPSVKRV